MPPLRKVARLVALALGSGLVAFALAVVVVWRVFRDHPGPRSEQYTTQGGLLRLDGAVAEYREQTHELPASLADLRSLDSYLTRLDRQGRLVDGWGRPFHYSVTGDRYLLLSYGRDDKPGGKGLDYDLAPGRRLPSEGTPTLVQFLLDKPTGGGLIVGAFAGTCMMVSVLVLCWPLLSEGNWRAGTLRTDSGDLLARPGLSAEEFLNTPLGGAAKVERRPPAYIRATTDPVTLGGYECVARLWFEEGLLEEAEIVVTESTAERFGFETGFAARHDGPEVEFLEEWIRRETGRKPPMRFRWGEIGQVYDGIGGYARIRFGYRPPRCNETRAGSASGETDDMPSGPRGPKGETDGQEDSEAGTAAGSR